MPDPFRSGMFCTSITVHLLPPRARVDEFPSAADSLYEKRHPSDGVITSLDGPPPLAGSRIVRELSALPGAGGSDIRTERDATTASIRRQVQNTVEAGQAAFRGMVDERPGR